MATLWLDGAYAGDHAAWLRRDVPRVLAALGVPGAELSVVLCGDAQIRSLNRAWRGVDAATDVLSFPQCDAFPPAPDAVLGDVVVSVDTAARQAVAQGHPLRVELQILLVHGLCHLLGHDHHEAPAAAAMRAAEARGLAALGRPTDGLVARAVLP